MTLLAGIVLSGWAGLALADDAGAIAGDYLLVGQMETASTLSLHADGRFDYALSVGSLDVIRAGAWNYDSTTRLLELRMDGAPLVEGVLRVDRVEPLASWSDRLPPDHPAWQAAQGLAVLVQSQDPELPMSALALGTDAEGDNIAWQADLLDDAGRWQVGDRLPVSLRVWEAGGEGRQGSMLDIDVPPSGSVVVVEIDAGRPVDADGIPPLWHWRVGDDGSLVPWQDAGIPEGSGSTARYIRR